jgi:hypothetical protein
VAEELHERVDAHVGVGELGGEGVAQTMNQCAGGPLAVDTRFLEGPQDPVLQRSAGDPFAVGAQEQGSGRGEAAQRVAARCPPACLRKAGVRAAFQDSSLRGRCESTKTELITRSNFRSDLPSDCHPGVFAFLGLVPAHGIQMWGSGGCAPPRHAVVRSGSTS